MAERTLILECVHGSRAYGLDSPDSDLDVKGVFVGSRAAHLGYRDWQEQVELSPDHVLYDVRKFFRLAVACNPTVLELLFVDEHDRRCVSEEGTLLLGLRDAFLSRRAADSFGRYGLSQLGRIRTHRRWLLEPPTHKPLRAEFGLPERSTIPRDQLGAAEAMLADGRMEEADVTPNFLAVMERERKYRAASAEWKSYQGWLESRNPKRAELERQHGYDTKHAMHLIRLLRMAVEILTEGVVRVRRPDAKELKAIRDGALSYDALVGQAEEIGSRLDSLAKKSALPEKPNEEMLDSLCVEIVTHVHRRAA